MRKIFGRTALLVALVLVLPAIAPSPGLPSPTSLHPATQPLSPAMAYSRPASMGYSAAQVGAALLPSSDPNYDEQIGTTFTQDTVSLTYNVTALAQTDANGYGPAYILNGLTSAGYWYQVGISYHWPSSSGGYAPNFGFSYQVYGPSGKPVYPANGGAGLGGFSKAVHSGDLVLLSLTFSGSAVQMLVQDWNTGATAKTSFSAFGAAKFVGSPYRAANSQGFFSGLMTEWYHVSAYSGNEGKVTYSNNILAISSAWMWIDEFDTSAPSSPVFINQTRSPVTFANEQQLYPFSSNGATIYGSAHVFITGLLNTASSRVELVPAAAEQESPSFSASFTLAGLAQSAEIAGGSSAVLEADPGTSITVSVNASSSGPLDKWVFSGGAAGSSIAFKAGSNVTYAYYHLVRELVSYQVAGGGAIPSNSAPAIIFMVPSSVASGTPTEVQAMQPLGTSLSEVYAILGSTVRVNGTIPGASGTRWAASAQNWTATAPDSLPNPIEFYYQYRVTVAYSIVGGGVPLAAPQFTATSLGSPTAVQISGSGTPVMPGCPQAGCASAGSTTEWVDAGSGYSFTSVLSGSTGERWVSSGGPAQPIMNPAAVVSETYTHQYYADLGVNDPRGGSVSQSSGWLEAGGHLDAQPISSSRWKFQTWDGSGPGAYSGTSPTISVTVNGPLTERATFYVQLAIEADRGTSIAYSYGSQFGTVQAGSTETLYVPPSSNVTLRAAPSSLVYSFASWEGSSIQSNTKPVLSLAVSSPTAVVGTSSYNYPVLGGATAVALAIIAASLVVRGRRRRSQGMDF